MPRVFWLQSACPRIVGSVLALNLAAGALGTFSAAHGSPDAKDSGNRTPAPAHTDTKFLVMDKDTVSSALAEGDTTFVIFIARSSAIDRFTFINEGKSARGQLKIAVANEKLSADSDKWMSVDGAVSFKSKRLFNVSMLGVDAKYVRLTFHVEHEDNLGTRNAFQTVALN